MKLQISATDVATAVFDILGDAVTAGDFETFKELFALPLNMAQGTHNVRVTSLEELHHQFARRHQRLKEIGASKLVRNCIAATYDTPERIFATHTGHVIKDNQRLTEPQPIYSILEKREGTWKITANECAVWVNDEKFAGEIKP